MSDILLYYRRPDPTTWVYLSSFLTIGLFFVFHRFWSIRNLDIVLLILLAPGLLMVHEGRRQQLRELEAVVAGQADDDRTDDDQQLDRSLSTEFIPAKTQAAAASFTVSNPIASLVRFAEPVVQQATENRADADGRDGSNAGSDSDSGERSDDTGSESNELLAGSDEGGPSGQEAAGPSSGESSDTDQSSHSEQVVAYTPAQIQRFGFVSLFVVQALILLRLMLDPLMVRRPLLEPNLTIGGLNFIGISLFIFMMANVLKSDPRIQVTQGPALGPGYAMMNMLPAIPTR